MFRCTAILFAVLAARVLFWLFLCRGKDLCRQPFGIPVEYARDENAVTTISYPEPSGFLDSGATVQKA